MVGAYRAESTDQWTTASAKKTPPLLNGLTSWCKYEELIDDWLDLSVLEARKRGPALKNRLVADADMHEGFLNREAPRAEDGVKYFQDMLRPHFIKGAQSISTRDFMDSLEKVDETLRWSSGSASFQCF